MVTVEAVIYTSGGGLLLWNTKLIGIIDCFPSKKRVLLPYNLCKEISYTLCKEISNFEELVPPALVSQSQPNLFGNVDCVTVTPFSGTQRMM
jgi:hypothetical protein